MRTGSMPHATRVVRNLYRGVAPSDAGLSHVEAELFALRDRLAAMGVPLGPELVR